MTFPARRLSILLVTLLLLVGGSLVAVRERAWEVSYFQVSGYHMVQDESGKFLYVDQGIGYVEILAVESDGIRLLGRVAVYPGGYHFDVPIAVARGWLFLASEGEFRAFDVRDPALANARAYGPARFGMEVRDIKVLGNLVLVSGSRCCQGVLDVGTVVALNMSDPPSSFSPNGSVDVAFRLDFVGPRVYTVAVDGTLFYVAEGDQAGHLHVFNASSSPPTEVLNRSVGMVSPEVFVSGPMVAAVGSIGGEGRLQLFRRSGSLLESLANLSHRGFVSFGDNEMFVTGGQPSSLDRDLSIYDLSTPTSPRRTAYFALQGLGRVHILNHGAIYSLGWDNLARIRVVEEPILWTRGLMGVYSASVVVVIVVVVALWIKARPERRARRAVMEPTREAERSQRRGHR